MESTNRLKTEQQEEEDLNDDDEEDEEDEAALGRTANTNSGGGRSRLAARKEKLDAAFEELSANNRLKYASFTELIYAALKTLGGRADLQKIYDWVGRHENWKRLDKKCTLSRACAPQY